MPSPSAAKRSARGSPPKPPGSGKKGPAAAAPPPEEEEDTRSVVPLHSDYDTKQGGARGQDGAAAEAARWGEQKIFECFFKKYVRQLFISFSRRFGSGSAAPAASAASVVREAAREVEAAASKR